MRRHRTGVWHNPDDTNPAETTLFNHLQYSGYHTMTCGKNDLHKGSDDYANSGWVPRLAAYGFDDAIDQRGKMNSGAPPNDRPGAYLEYLRAQGLMQTHIDDYAARCLPPSTFATSPWPSPLPREHFTDDFCGRTALELLDRRPTEKPWCLWVNFPGPHDPHDAPRELQKRYDGVSFPPPVCGEATMLDAPIDHQQLRRNYAANCEGIDDWVGRIVERLEDRGELDNTVIVFFSDHGEMLGDHGRWAKCTWHEPSVHVPLIVAGPGIAAGKVSEALAELIDVHATCLDYAGIAALDDSDALSIRPILEGGALDASHRDVAISALDDWRMITDGRWKLVRISGEKPERPARDLLFDLQEDGTEQNNVAESHPEVIRDLAAKLDQHSPTELRARNGVIPWAGE